MGHGVRVRVRVRSGFGGRGLITVTLILHLVRLGHFSFGAALTFLARPFHHLASIVSRCHIGTIGLSP